MRVARAVVRWYLRVYFRTAADPGVAAMFCDPSRVGAFAVDRAALRAGDGQALFRLLVAVAMFQRRQDVQILRILRGIGASDAAELQSSDVTISRSGRPIEVRGVERRMASHPA